MDPTALAVQIADRHRSDPSSRPRPAAWTVRRDPSVTALDVLFGVACNLALRYGLPIVAFEVLSSAARLCAETFWTDGCFVIISNSSSSSSSSSSFCFPDRRACWSALLVFEACFAAWMLSHIHI